MAEERPDSDAGDQQQPPRIKLNGNGNGANGHTPPPAKAPPPASAAGAPPVTIKIPTGEVGKKKETSRIDLAQAQAPQAAPALVDIAKKTTARIAPAPGAIKPVSEAERQELFKKSTVRVRVEDAQAKAPPGPAAQATPADVAAAKKQTSRIDLQEVLGGDEDLFKRRTAMLDPNKFPPTPTEAPGAPKTIRIKRPDGAAATGPVALPAEAPPPAIEPITMEARKSETARIEMPEGAVEQAPTRRKTIRIKRPDGGGEGRPLTISAPSPAIARTRPMELEEAGGEAEEEGESALFAVLALAAVLMACVLVYVLAAQVGTVESLAAPNVPFPGGV